MAQPIEGHRAAAARAQTVAQRADGATPRDATPEPYIGLVTRIIAFAFDAFVINAVALVVGAIIALVFSILPAAHIPDAVTIVIGGMAFALWVIGYFTVFWTTTGETPGNRLLDIRVVRADASNLKPRHALVRLIGMVLSAPLLLGFLPILVTARRRGLHDWLAGTVVIGARAEGHT